MFFANLVYFLMFLLPFLGFYKILGMDIWMDLM